MHKKFIEQVIAKIRNDKNVIGLAVAGSFITNEVDEYSDVDLVLVTREKIAPDAGRMMTYARSLGNFLNGFTGEHVGDRRVLICLYDDPLLHVDIKFLTPDEFEHRVEDPVVVWDPEKQLEKIISSTKSEWPKLNYQWIEDRFWTWVHYMALKLGRGENFEALDGLSFLRTTVISPLLQVKNGKLPRGVRKVETNFKKEDLDKLTKTIPQYSAASVFEALDNTINLYRELRQSIFPAEVVMRTKTEEKAMEYLTNIKKQKLKQPF